MIKIKHLTNQQIVKGAELLFIGERPQLYTTGNYYVIESVTPNYFGDGESLVNLEDDDRDLTDCSRWHNEEMIEGREFISSSVLSDEEKFAIKLGGIHILDFDDNE